MGKKSWFSAVKKAVSPSFSKVKKDKRSQKSKSNPKNTWLGNQMSLDTSSSQTEATLANPPQYHQPQKDTEVQGPENDQINQVDAISYATPMVEDAQDIVSHAAAEVNCVTSSPNFLLGKSREEISAIKIQTANRGCMAKNYYQTLRARKRLKVLIQGQAVKRQTSSALMRMQTMARVQSQVQARGIRMAEVNEALQRQRQRREKTPHKRSGFDLSSKSKEQVEARLRNNKEAAERREKALAYSYFHQQTWRNSLLSANPTVMESNYPDWGWNWSEQWNAIRPWETGITSNKQPVSSPTKALSSLSGAKVSTKVVFSPMARSHKGSTISVNVRSRISNPGPPPLGSGKKGTANTRSGVGLAKKLSYSPSSGIRKTLGAPRKSSPRWNP